LCGANSRDTLSIDFQLPPAAQNDERTIEFAVETVVDVLANDAVPEGSTLEISMEPFNGRAVVTADNQIAYTPDPDFAGTDELVYQVCREGCACDDAILRLTVGEGVDCDPPNIFTPNGDGVNEAFIVPCLLDTGLYPDSQLSVFNRWGDEVYNSPRPYPNNWAGTFNGEDLPADTYFYILDLGDGSQPVTGYLLLQK
jgi:gliding motility-associated-like protein